jgi:ATP-dependent DNA helicase RecG
VQRLARPIEFASRDAYAHLGNVKSLGPFVSTQVLDALAGEIYPPHVETDLLGLRAVFGDFDILSDPAERRQRVEQAQAILSRLNAPDAFERTPAAHAAPAELWNLPVQFAKGVGPKRAALLAKLGVATVVDAMWYVPRRYEDRSSLLPIGQLVPGATATVSGTVGRVRLNRIPRRRMTVLNATVEDETGALQCVYFNQPYLEDVFKPGRRIMVSGMVLAGRKGWTDLRMDVPQYEVLDDEDAPLHVGRIVPVYSETKGLTSRQLRTLIKRLLDHYLDGMDDVVPATVRSRQRLLPVRAALREVHFPQSPGDLDALNKGVRFDTATPLIGKLRALLPFRLTQAQERVLTEIQRDMASQRPMNRLIQGDVGCGKTVVALLAMVTACGSGCQAALMVPTEILAEQHYLNMRRLLEGLGLTAVLLTGGGTPKTRAAARKQIEGGEAQIAIGTHALIQKHVQFAKLGLVVIDEQHKFGVLQRKTLLAKGYRPDVLVLTATPIPRTLAMTVYGDLDVSVIDALPPGRKPIRTKVFEESERARAYQFAQQEVRAGRQVYIVYPLIEESEKVDLRAAVVGAERLQESVFRAARVGLLHGRMKGDEKERTMAAFKAGKIQVLVSTTVIEVGVDVPNASVMLIEHAERFGLAQLHQLRGRVGRSAQQSYCLLLASLVSGAEGSAASRRLEALVRSGDGFVIAEEDLRLRGPGEFFGSRQWGVPEFRVANLIRDHALLEQARHEAQTLVREDPRLTASEHQPAREAMRRRWQTKLVLGSVS